jgi:hypothetical protein
MYANEFKFVSMELMNFNLTTLSLDWRSLGPQLTGRRLRMQEKGSARDFGVNAHNYKRLPETRVGHQLHSAAIQSTANKMKVKGSVLWFTSKLFNQSNRKITIYLQCRIV